MKAAFVIFNGMTALDFVGAYDPITRLHSMGFMPDFQWDVCAPADPVTDDRGLRFGVGRAAESLAGYDLLIVAGGHVTRTLQNDNTFIDWIRTAANVPLKTSVCSGALLLGAAGFLKGRPATTHPSVYNDLAKYCSKVVEQRIVDDGDVITAGGVSSSIDLGLYLVERLAGVNVREQIAKQMQYRAAIA